MNKELSELRRKARQLQPSVIIGRAGITDGSVGQVRRALTHNILIKVRVVAEDRDAVRAAVDALVAQVPCRLIERKGFVAVLYVTPADVQRFADAPIQSEVQ